MTTPTERPTAESYRDLANDAERDTYVVNNAGQRDNLHRYAHALRCAAEDAEKMQEIMAEYDRHPDEMGVVIALHTLLGGDR